MTEILYSLFVAGTLTSDFYAFAKELANYFLSPFQWLWVS